jgi:hypothetical protein
MLLVGRRAINRRSHFTSAFRDGAADFDSRWSEVRYNEACNYGP